MDTTQPTTPEFFMEHGAASPEHARMLSEQAETMAGRRGPDARAALNITARDQPPPVATPTAAVPMTHAEIQESLAAHQNAQLAQELDKSMMPPPAPDFYQFPQGLTPQTDEAIAADQELRAAFHSEGFPRYLVESIGKDLAAAARTRMQETPEERSSEWAAFEPRLRNGTRRLTQISPWSIGWSSGSAPAAARRAISFRPWRRTSTRFRLTPSFNLPNTTAPVAGARRHQCPVSFL